MREATRSKPMTTALLSIPRLRPSSGVHRGLDISPSGTARLPYKALYVQRVYGVIIGARSSSFASSKQIGCAEEMPVHFFSGYILDLPNLYLNEPQTWRPLTTTNGPHACDLHMGYMSTRSQIRSNRCNTTFLGFSTLTWVS